MIENRYTIALFGESEKGEYRTGYVIDSLSQLSDFLGHPPDHSRGVHYAIQALLYERNLIFIRVREEGYSLQDYKVGLARLMEHPLIEGIAALFLPGVGNKEIVEASIPLCQHYHTVLVLSEPDLYDYLKS